MRLTQQEVADIIQALSFFIKPAIAVELYLFGSRTNDDLKGGDIDLLLVCKNQNVADMLLGEKHIILSKIKSLIGEQRIDLKIASRNELESDPFLKVIFPEAILLNNWP